MDTVVITNCTGRKRVSEHGALEPDTDGWGDVGSFSKAWAAELKRAVHRQPIGDLYVGRSVVEAAAAAQSVNARRMFVSAGLGLVDAIEAWPNYNLTISAGEGSIAPFLARSSSSFSTWWSALNAAMRDGDPLRMLLASSCDRVLLALPANYAHMVSQDLEGATDAQLNKLRVFTSRDGVAALGERTRKFVMPYDERLEAKLPGTKNDFPQRSMRHFVEHLNANEVSSERGREMVQDAMRDLVAPKLPSRVKASDDEIVVMLKQQWERFEGQSSKLLRFLRDEALVACEQNRFRDLCRHVKSQLETEKTRG